MKHLLLSSFVVIFTLAQSCFGQSVQETKNTSSNEKRVTGLYEYEYEKADFSIAKVRWGITYNVNSLSFSEYQRGGYEEDGAWELLEVLRGRGDTRWSRAKVMEFKLQGNVLQFITYRYLCCRPSTLFKVLYYLEFDTNYDTAKGWYKLRRYYATPGDLEGRFDSEDPKVNVFLKRISDNPDNPNAKQDDKTTDDDFRIK